MSRHNNNIVGCAAAVLASLLFGCALPRTAPPRPAQLPVPAPAAATPPAPPAAPPTPPRLAVSPRAEAPATPRVEATPPPPTEPPIPAGRRGRFVVLNFDNADVETVVHAASEIVGFNYVLAPDVRGKVTVQTSGRIPQEDVFGVLLAVLEVHGFTAIKSGNLYKIVRIEGARERAVPTIIGATPDPARTTDEIVTQIVPLRYAAVTDVSTLLRPLISARGNLIAHRETNILVVTDTASNIRRVLEIVRQVDVQVTLEELQIIPLRYADAGQTAQVLTQIFQRGLRPATPGVPGPPVPAPPPGLPSPAAGPQAPGAQAGAAAERPPLIIAEPRSNSLIVNARRHELETIRRLVDQLDINVGGGRRVFVYYAENAKAKDLAVTLNAIYGLAPTGSAPSPTAPRPPGPPLPTLAPPPPSGAGTGAAAGAGGGRLVPGDLSVVEGQLGFIADETTNAIIVTTLPRIYPEIEATIKQLDRMPRQVLIEVLVAEITLNDDTKLGMDWAIKQGRFSLGSVSNTSGIPSTAVVGSAATITSPTSLIPTPGLGALGPLGAGLTAFTFETGRFFSILNALASENRVNVVSNPHIMTSENKKAVINVSTSVPIVTSQQVPLTGTTTGAAAATPQPIGTQSVEYRDAGVILTVTPRIGERGTVALDIKQEVNDILALATGTLNSPQFSKREAETSVVLLNNQTLVLGGLIKDQVTINNRGIPLLKDIPILGYLFGFKQRALIRTELLLLITPRVVGTALDAQRITDQMRRATPELEDTIRRAPRAPAPSPPPPPTPEAPASP
jgi:general secretion pathway protein D